MDEFKRNLVTHIPALLRYANALTGQVSLAEDLVQDTLERALKKSHLWDSSRKLNTWLHTILHNIFVDHYRRSKSSPLVELENDMLSPSNQASHIDYVTLHEVQINIHSLPAEQREVLLLVTLEGLDYKSVSQIIDAPIGTVMSRLHRARKQLLMKRDENVHQTEEIVDHE